MTKTRQKVITLVPGERIIAVVPERVSGPGWSNTPVWVYITDTVGQTLRFESIQPEEQSDELRILHSVSAELCSTLVEAVPIRHTNPTK